MPKYRWIGPNAVVIPDAGVTVSPGQEFDCDADLNHPYIELVGKKPSKPAGPED